jgi:hypothetical protein
MFDKKTTFFMGKNLVEGGMKDINEENIKDLGMY